MNQFQIEHYFGKESEKTGIFDWIIVSPASTVQVLEQMLDGTIYEKFLDSKMYVMTSGGMIQHTGYESLYLWHEEMYDMPRLLSKMRHLIDNTLALTGNVYLLWTNAQSNLPMNVSHVQDDIGRYVLTVQRYDALSTLATQLFNARCIFIVAETLVEEELLSRENVTILDTKDLWSRWWGPTIYDHILVNIAPKKI
jgi:hypothetical protein